MLIREIETEFHNILNKWSGCHWTTQFGPRELDLNGLRSKQAALIADATSGTESVAWWEAVEWLKSVEHDAKTASEFAHEAWRSAQADKWKEAIELINNAVALESKYPNLKVWRPLKTLMATAAVQTINRGFD